MKGNMFRKGLAVVIIVFFIGMSITPSSGNMMSSDDTIPPVTTHILDPPEPDGLNGWYISDVTITLEAYDEMSGVNTTYYSVNSEPWEIYNEPFILSEDGLQYLVYFSVDNAGNMEFPKLAHLKMDQTPPKVDLTYEWTGYKPPDTFIFTAIATDATSGMERVEFYIRAELQKIIIGPGPEYVWELIYIPPCLDIVIAKAYDIAGLSAYDSIKDPKSKINSNSMSVNINNMLYGNKNIQYNSLLSSKNSMNFFLKK